MKTKIFSLFLLAGLALSACTPAAAPPEHAEETTGHAVHWTYEGEGGPDHWGELAPDYATCGTGTSQSPIDLTSANAQDVTNIAFHYQPTEVKIQNNGHTVQVTYDAGSYIEVDGQRYDVAQFHYHAPSEHAVDGKLYAAELHIVHKNAAGELALVVGILFEEGAENPAFTELLAHLPAEESPETDAGFMVNAADFLPDVQTTFRYSGSLTTPPCSEGINWFVMTTPVELSADQIAAFEHVHEGNNRPVQPLNTRTLTEDTTP